MSSIVERRKRNDDVDVDATPLPAAKRRRTSQRNWVRCQDIKKLPSNLCCSGCFNVESSTRKKPRNEYTAKKFDCFQGWKQDENKVRKAMVPHVQKIKAWIFDHENIDCDAAFDEAPDPKVMSFVTPQAQPPPQQKSKRAVRLHQQTVSSNGTRVTVRGIPKTHSIVLAADLNRWKNDSTRINIVRQKLQSNQHATASAMTQSLWAIAMSAVPTLALSAAQHFIPMVVHAFLYDTGTFDKLDRNQIAKSFPSNWTLRQMMLKQAARDSMSLGLRLADKKTCIAADKGNKRNVGHLVKFLSWMEPAPAKAYKQLLDIDAAGGSSKECAKGVQASIDKLKAHDDDETHKLHGQDADSGGGGTLDSLHKEMRVLNLCMPDEEHLTAGCAIHAIQLQLGNAIRETFGAGALDKVNAMQLLHSVYRLQELVDLQEWWHVLFKSCVFVLNYNPAQAAEDDASIALLSTADQNRNAFYMSYNKILDFHSKFKKPTAEDPTSSALKKFKLTVYGKMTAPILTRWWTVGVGASYIFDCYLVLFHAAQTVINIYTSGLTPHMIASDLFSLMLSQDNFIDICLIRSFHKACVNKHMDWLQSSVDLTDALAFQSHNIAVRCFIMTKDLQHLLSGRSLPDYLEATSRCTDEDDKKRNFDKLSIFVKHAGDSLHKHCGKWLSPKLLPAALLSE